MNAKTEIAYTETSATYQGAFPLYDMVQGEGKKKARALKAVQAYLGVTLNGVLENAPPFAWEEVTIGEGELAQKVQLPRYEDARVQYLQDGLTARIEAAAKGKLASGSDLPTTIDEIFESQAGQYRKLLKELKEAVVVFMQGLGLPEGVRTTAVRLLDTDTLKETTDGNKAFMRNLLNKFATANPEHAAAYASPLARLQDAASEEVVELDLGMLED